MKKPMLITLFLTALIIVNQLVAQNTNRNVRLRAHVTYPNQRFANCYGYTQNGREYALLGATQGMIITDVTNPDIPSTVIQVAPLANQWDPNSAWQEIKVYKNFAYIVSVGGTSLQIVNLSNLPNSNLAVNYYTGDGGAAGQIRQIHTLHIDTLRGFLYLFGGAVQGAIVFRDVEKNKIPTILPRITRMSTNDS
jgi:hypothetical protein